PPAPPLLCFSSRMDAQKGLELFIPRFEELLQEFNFQFIANGDGESRYKAYFQELAKKFPGRVAVNFGFNLELVRRLFSGCDMLLIPSLFEPCGLVQMEAMRYGCVPVARAVGGLADTIADGKNGFLFKNFTPLGFNGAIIRALEHYRDEKEWQGIVRSCMKEDFSWEKSAKRYRELYEKLLG
ncbi:MAG: glycosyltransferase, partial [Patescibacteria group bacterium]